MKPRHIFGLLLLLSWCKAYPADPVYPAWLIPDSLKKNANAVVRFDDFNIEIGSGNIAQITNIYAITILNARGDEHAMFIAPYDKLRKLTSFSVRIYDANGWLIEDVKNKDVHDYSAISGFSLYEDDRVKYYKPAIGVYPYTVVFKYHYTFNGYLQLPRWQPQSSSDVAIQSARLIISMPDDKPVKWLQKNILKPPIEKRDGKIITCTWELNNLKAFIPEYLQPDFADLLPVVYISPVDFNLEGYKGNLETWESFGAWVNLLLEGKNNLPEETHRKIQALTAGLTDTLEMVRLVYEYMQQHTRYVSIQLGIGGFQPFDAATVDRVGYGDCKALTNYTKSLLEAIQIRSVYTLVRAGSGARHIITDFPSQQFNHVILAVPLLSDTVWLECTNQDIPFGYLGRFTSNRCALAITPKGGVLVKTPRSHPDSNVVETNARIKLDENGNCSAAFEIAFRGLKYDDVFGFIHSDAESQRQWLIKRLYVPNARLQDYSIANHPHRAPVASVKADFQIDRYAVKSGKRMFVTLNPVDAYPDLPAKGEDRLFDIEISESDIQTDSLVFTLPAGYTVEHFPARVELASSFGEFSARVEQHNEFIIYTRKLKIMKGYYDASCYSDFYHFFSNIVKSDKAKLVITRGGL